ncbi:uncharacterized protein SAPINGB_P005857 [Magnusiomyces paraingens]|uniref:General transcription and DNA repair factor IIH n=1 Tax=Magnusiomyces paraingens TaxID=2606893 RepID=A0A5E8C2D5_9ASCO|nr:uncharacterized protein SAPINGB_P005857 [Saprochaete ingens]VVT57763.1 unnamed protein product [Saprochaete ingens]
MDDSDDEYTEGSELKKSSNASRRSKSSKSASKASSGGRVNAEGSASIKSLKSANGSYAWEDKYQRSWDIVMEDDEGSLEGAVAGMVEASKKRRITKTSIPFQRGIIRNFVLILDLSFAMLEKDLLPNRYQLMLTYAIDFVKEFYNQNPISQMAVVGMSEGLAVLISDLSGSLHNHISALQKLRKQEPKGDPSLQNALEMARGLLYHAPRHSTREVLIIFGALFSSDPGDIHQTIDALVKAQIRVRVIGLAAQVAVCKELSMKTNFGDEKAYGIILNDAHFKELLHETTTPLAVNKLSTQGASTLVKMGFPSRISEVTSTLCSCHSKITRGGYICPRCRSKVCNLPSQCPCCDLTLVFSTHLARSYHHLFPLKPYLEVEKQYAYLHDQCFSCQFAFPLYDSLSEDGSTSRYSCPDCNNFFCIDCDLYVHETLHNCPGCETKAIKPALIPQPTLKLKISKK